MMELRGVTCMKKNDVADLSEGSNDWDLFGIF